MKQLIVLLFCISASFISRAQQLDELIELAIEHNPKLNSLALKTQISQEGELQAKSWKNTKFNTAVFISEPETRTGPQRFQLSASQPIPAFGRITARSSYAKSLSDLSYQQWVIAKRKLLLDLSKVYYSYQVALKKHKLINSHIQRLDRYIDIATNKLSSSKTSLVNVFELKMRREEFNNKLEQLQTSFGQLDAQLSALLNTDELIEVKEDPNFNIKAEEPPIDFKTLELHPELTQYELLYTSVLKEQELNDKERLPGLGLGINYINVADRTDLNPIDNGKDILAPMLSISVPVFNKTFKSKERQLELKADQIKSQQVERKNELLKRLQIARVVRTNALIDYQSQSKNLNLAHQSLELVLAQYQSNAKGVEKLLDIQQQEFNYAFNQLTALGNYFKGQLLIEYLTNQ